MLGGRRGSCFFVGLVCFVFFDLVLFYSLWFCFGVFWFCVASSASCFIYKVVLQDGLQGLSGGAIFFSQQCLLQTHPCFI